MAKGRKLTISRSERFLGSYNYSLSHGTDTHVSELGEEDVWPTVDETVNGDDQSTNGGSRGEWSPRSIAESNGGGVSMRTRSSRRSSQEEGHVAVGGLSHAFDDDDDLGGKTAASRIVHQYRCHDSMASPRGHQMASSAPVNVPDWTKIYRVDSVESLPDSDDGVDDHNMDMVPPHEYLAREYGRSRNSVFEGVGRTLKGRDLRRVRDAVWSQTGFDG